MHAVEDAPDISSFVDVWNDRTEPPKVDVKSMSDRRTTFSIHSPADDSLDVAPPELHSFRTSDGVELRAAVYRPPTSGPAPVIGSGYCGSRPQVVEGTLGPTGVP